MKKNRKDKGKASAAAAEVQEFKPLPLGKYSQLVASCTTESVSD